MICSLANLAETGGRGYWGDVYVCDVEGTLVRRLTRTPRIHDENPVYSPDGTQILWNRPALGGAPGEREELWIMDANGESKVRLMHFTTPDHEDYRPGARQITEADWSPDGS